MAINWRQQECSFLSTDSGATSLFIIYFLGARVLWTEGMSLARTRKNMWLASRIPSLPFLLPHIREEEAGKRFLFLISVQPLIEKKSGRDRIQTHFPHYFAGVWIVSSFIILCSRASERQRNVWTLVKDYEHDLRSSYKRSCQEERKQERYHQKIAKVMRRNPSLVNHRR